ncbi:MAG: hypothetical protein AABY07_07245, partial [Nanoarchaeota archaeon]
LPDPLPTIPEIIATFAAPMQLMPILLEIDPIEFSTALLSLMPPPIPSIPIPPIPEPSIFELKLDALLEVNLKFFKLPFETLKELIKEFPNLVFDLSLPGLVGIACKTGAKLLQVDPTLKPAEAAASIVLAEESVGMAILSATGTMIGPGVILKEFSKGLGYDTKELPISEEDKLEPAKTNVPNPFGLIRLPNNENYIKLFEGNIWRHPSFIMTEASALNAGLIANDKNKFVLGTYKDSINFQIITGRNKYWGFPGIIKTIELIAEHMKNNFSYIIEVGNLTSPDKVNNYSVSHAGGPFDLGYPYILGQGEEVREASLPQSTRKQLGLSLDEIKKNSAGGLGIDDNISSNPFRTDTKNIDYQMLYNLLNTISKINIVKISVIGKDVFTKLGFHVSQNNLSMPKKIFDHENHNDHIHITIDSNIEYKVEDAFFVPDPGLSITDESTASLANKPNESS